MPRLSQRLVSLTGLVLLVAAALPLPPDVAHAQAQVVVVHGDYLGENGLPNQEKSRECFERVVGMLKAARVPHVVTKDSRVESEGLPPATVAIFPYNRAMTDAEAQQVLRFIDSGGKVIVFFVAHQAVLERLGVCRSSMIPATDVITALAVGECLPGVPEEVAWRPEHAVAAQFIAPDGATSRAPTALATWRTKAGATTAQPALLTCEAGVYLTSDPRGLATSAGGALLRGIIGQLAPAMWPVMLPADPAQFGSRGRFASLAQLQAYLTKQTSARAEYQDALGLATEAGALLGEMKAAVEAGEIERALALETRARQAAEAAYWASYPSIPGELRGVWMCNYAEPSWPVAVKHLQQANFNAIFPYMMSGGVAFYRSKALPVHPAVRAHGDYLAEAVAAAKAVEGPNGVGAPSGPAGNGAGWGPYPIRPLQVHARMLNLSTLFAPAEAKAALRKAGRLMVTTGGQTSDWLCPTHPANRQAQVTSALEMASYGVAGIQFDYLRYPWKDACFCGRCRAKFQQQHAIKVARWPADVVDGAYRGRFADWRREQITSLIAEMSQAVRKHYPGVAVSAAVFLNWESHRETFGQDWVAWIDRGLVDFVCPMDYTSDMAKFDLYVSRQEKWIGGKLPWAAGLGVYADGCKYGGPELALEQIRVAREHGSQGFVIFNYSPDLVTDYLPWLRKGVTKTPTEFGKRGRGEEARR